MRRSARNDSSTKVSGSQTKNSARGNLSPIDGPISVLQSVVDRGELLDFQPDLRVPCREALSLQIALYANRLSGMPCSPVSPSAIFIETCPQRRGPHPRN